MLVRRILDLDFHEISKWFDARGAKLPDRSLFPKTGFIIDSIAAGFLYFTDSTVGIIDCYISNPDTDSKTRSYALDQITNELIKFARSHGCYLLKCDTKIEAIKQRALNHGFKALGSHESFYLETINRSDGNSHMEWEAY